MYQPSARTRTSPVRNADLRDENDFTKNFFLDYKPVTVLSFPSIETAAGPADLASMGTGAAPVSDINTSDIGGLTLATTDTHGFKVELPYDMDPAALVGFRCKWLKIQAIAAGTGSALLALTYNAVPVGVNTPMAIGATPLSVPIPLCVDLAQYVEVWTEIGTIAEGSLSALTPGDDCLDMLLTNTLDTITDATLTAVQMWYKARVL